MANFWQRLGSYLWGVKLAEYHSDVSGTLELWLINGRNVLNTRSVNYSFDSLHRVFQNTFRLAGVQKHPPGKVLLLGFGAGSVVHILHKEYRWKCVITGVDLDPLTFRLAQEHFSMQPSTLLRFVTDDAAHFITTDTKSYDWIILDVFVNEQVPDVFTRGEFLQHALARLVPGGNLFMNLIDTHPQGKVQTENVQKFLETQPGKTSRLKPLGPNTVIRYEAP